MTVVALARLLREGELSPVEAVTAALGRIRALDGELNAFISVRWDEAPREAEAAQRGRERGPLRGVPLAVKDVLDVAGSATTAGSRILADNVAEHDAEAVARLRRAPRASCRPRPTASCRSASSCSRRFSSRR
jgi:aspartyl-tRNA(Asn)/glutamyl-tRNA(Gln) amidotransferase subunit A